MKIAPKINAIGRIIDDNDDIKKTVVYFTSDDRSLLLNYNLWINHVNGLRKEITKSAIEAAKNIDVDQAAIVAIINQKEGIIGLIANGFVKKHNKPTIIFALDSSGEFYKGSCRAPQGFNVVNAFNELSEYIAASGGHAMAGGCSIKIENYEIFKEKFIALAESFPPAVVVKMDTIDLYINEITRDNYELVNSFSPFGENWPNPHFKLSRIRVDSLLYSRDGQHITTSIGNFAKLTGFHFSRDEMSKYQYIDMIGTLRLSTYYGKTSVEFLINEINESKK